MNKILTVMFCAVVLSCNVSGAASVEYEISNEDIVSENDLLDQKNDTETIQYDEAEVPIGDGDSTTIENMEMIDIENGEDPAVISADQVSINEETQDDITEMPIDIESEEDGESVSESENTAEKVLEGSEELSVMKISIPANIEVILDPENFGGKGEVYSDRYKIINYGNKDIWIKIKKINAFCRYERGLYDFLGNYRGQDMLSENRVSIYVNWKNDDEEQEKILDVKDGEVDEYVLCLKAAKYDENGKYIGLNKGSKGEFYLGGSLNTDSNANVQWEECEFSVGFDYEIDNTKEDITNEFYNENAEIVSENISNDGESISVNESSSAFAQDGIVSINENTSANESISVNESTSAFAQDGIVSINQSISANEYVDQEFSMEGLNLEMSGEMEEGMVDEGNDLSINGEIEEISE